MDTDYLIKRINEDRHATLRLTTNSGKTIDLPPGARAYWDATDTIHLHWPPENPENPFKISQSMMISGVNVSTLEPDQQNAG